jgi:hypothetical protein
LERLRRGIGELRLEPLLKGRGCVAMLVGGCWPAAHLLVNVEPQQSVEDLATFFGFPARNCWNWPCGKR